MSQFNAWSGLCCEQSADETNLPTVDQVLNERASELGRDFVGYRNHVYRVANLCLAIVGEERDELEKIAVAAVFHDLGIWTNHTFDYIAPSASRARSSRL